MTDEQVGELPPWQWRFVAAPVMGFLGCCLFWWMLGLGDLFPRWFRVAFVSFYAADYLHKFIYWPKPRVYPKNEDSPS